MERGTYTKEGHIIMETTLIAYSVVCLSKLPIDTPNKSSSTTQDPIQNKSKTKSSNNTVHNLLYPPPVWTLGRWYL